MTVDENRAPTIESSPAAHQARNFAAIVLSVTLLSAIPRLYLATSHRIEYDGYWHVFIAQQDQAANFFREIEVNAHPPLFFFLLKGLLVAFGRHDLIYRAVSLISGIASVALIALICRRLRFQNSTTVLASTAAALSIAAVILSIEVRSYMLAVFFVLAAFNFYLDILFGSQKRPFRRSLFLFVIAMTLALLSHYSVFFVVGAFAVVPIILALTWPSYRAAAGPVLRREWPWIGAGLAIIVSTVAAMFYFHADRTVATNHLRRFLLLRGEEGFIEFFWRNLVNLVNLFSPVEIQPSDMGVLILTVAAIVVALVGGSNAKTRQAVPAFVLGILILEIAAAAVLGAYPFGGELRHQAVVLPFILLGAFTVVDLAVRASRFRMLTVALFAAAILANAFVEFRAFPVSRENLFKREVDLYRRNFSGADAVFVDQFNLIIFFTHHHQYDWRYVGRARHNPAIQKYSLASSHRRVGVFRHTDMWNVDYADLTTYLSVRESLDSSRVRSVVLFGIRQTPATVPSSTIQKRVEMLASHAGLRATRVVVDGSNVFAEFTRAESRPGR